MTGQRTVAELEGFIDLLVEACADPELDRQLRRILELPDAQRKLVVGGLLQEMRRRNAPADLAAAIACLRDDAVAEKAYEVIVDCRRNSAVGRPESPSRPDEHDGPLRWLVGTAGLAVVTLVVAFMALLALAVGIRLFSA